MPRRSKGPRLYLDPKRKQWIIRDGSRFVRTSCGERDGVAAEKYLAQYIGQKHRPQPSPTPLIADVLNVYGTEVAPYKKSARNYAYNIATLLKWWGTKTIESISAKTCRQYADDRPGKMGAGADLKVLRWAVQYWHREYGPLHVMPTFWQPKYNQPKERWLTRSEAARLLWSARKHLHLRRMILLGLYTGSRPGVILALRWNQVDLQSSVMTRLAPNATPDEKKRAPKVRLGDRILTHLRRWQRLDGAAMPYVCHFEGHTVADPHGTWRRAVKDAGLQGVTRHTLRHTRATWLMQRAVDPFQAAGHLGMSMRTLERVYAHHHPDWQVDAANI